MPLQSAKPRLQINAQASLTHAGPALGVGEAAQETPVALAAMLGIDQTRPNRLTHAQPAPAALAVVVAWRDASMRVRSRSARMVLPNPGE